MNFWCYFWFFLAADPLRLPFSALHLPVFLALLEVPSIHLAVLYALLLDSCPVARLPTLLPKMKAKSGKSGEEGRRVMSCQKKGDNAE